VRSRARASAWIGGNILRASEKRQTALVPPPAITLLSVILLPPSRRDRFISAVRVSSQTIRPLAVPTFLIILASVTDRTMFLMSKSSDRWCIRDGGNKNHYIISFAVTSQCRGPLTLDAVTTVQLLTRNFIIESSIVSLHVYSAIRRYKKKASDKDGNTNQHFRINPFDVGIRFNLFLPLRIWLWYEPYCKHLQFSFDFMQTVCVKYNIWPLLTFCW
jgi:hypothetical protein